MTLHIVSNCHALTDCLDLAAGNDPIMLISDGVYALHTHATRLNNRLTNATIYALTDDLTARGLSSPVAIDYVKFVELSTAHNPIQSWY